MKLERNSEKYQLNCAQQVVAILFEHTGLSGVIRNAPAVIVGLGNWISFTADEALSREIVLRLQEPSGELSFIADSFNRSGGSRSRTSPSLHLTNLGSGASLVGHVDAHYWARNPLGHADEFLTKKTAEPSNLLKRLLFRL